MIREALFGLAIVGLSAQYAAADSQCSDYKTIVAALAKQFGEAASIVATSVNGMVLTFTVNVKTGSWTLLAQPTDELTCIIGGGDNWETAPDSIKALGKPGEPS